MLRMLFVAFNLVYHAWTLMLFILLVKIFHWSWVLFPLQFIFVRLSQNINVVVLKIDSIDYFFMLSTGYVFCSPYCRMQGENTEEKLASPPPSKLSSPTTEALETAILKVFLNTGSCVIVKFAVDTLVKVIIFFDIFPWSTEFIKLFRSLMHMHFN